MPFLTRASHLKASREVQVKKARNAKLVQKDPSWRVGQPNAFFIATLNKVAAAMENPTRFPFFPSIRSYRVNKGRVMSRFQTHPVSRVPRDPPLPLGRGASLRAGWGYHLLAEAWKQDIIRPILST